MAKLHILLDSRESSITSARDILLKKTQNEFEAGQIIHVNFSKSNLIERYEELIKHANYHNDDHILISMQHINEADQEAIDEKKSQSRTENITICPNEYKKRKGDNTLRIWIQFHLMRAIINRDNLSKIIKKCITLPIIPDEEKKRAKQFFDLGEPKMAGGSYSGENDKNPIDTIRRNIRICAHSDAHILIKGDSGTGKEGAAFFIHELSKRRDYPFITLNCSGFTETILDSELFGYTPGTMTDGLKGGKKGIVHETQNGTLFLDELPDMSPTLQGKLLRFAQTGEYRQVGGTKKEYLNVRIVAAGQPALLQGVRPDLLARLSRLELQIPPLKKMEAESPGTIMKIANSLLEEQTWETVWDDKKREEIVLTPQDIGKKKEELQSKYEEQLKKAPWKNSNIRELLNAIECWIRFGDNGMNEYLQGQTEDTNSNIKNNTTFAILLQAAVDSVALDDLPKIFTETKNNKGLKLHDHLHHHYFKAVRDYRGTAVEPVIIGKLTGTNKRTVIKFLNG